MNSQEFIDSLTTGDKILLRDWGQYSSEVMCAGWLYLPESKKIPEGWERFLEKRAPPWDLKPYFSDYGSMDVELWQESISDLREMFSKKEYFNDKQNI